MTNCKWAAWEEKGQLTYWPTQTVLANTCLMGSAWSHDCPEKMDQFCLSEDSQVCLRWGPSLWAVPSALRKQSQTGASVLPSAWQAGDGADSECGGLALQPSPGALGQTGSNRGRNKTLPMAANVTWKALFLRRRWFIKLPVTSWCREKMKMVALEALWEVKGPKRLSRSHCLPQTGSRNLAVTTHPHSFLRKACLLWECIRCICSSSCRANGVTVPEDVAQWYTAFFTTLINGYQEKLQKLFQGEKKKKGSAQKLINENRPDSKFSRVSEKFSASGWHSY